jgi:pimeloyl-ACP methyl ester carboxylesterase
VRGAPSPPKTYTAYDYADITNHLIKRWKIADLEGLSGEAAAAQEYLMKQPARIRRLADFGAAKARGTGESCFSRAQDLGSRI